jgi:hypothetical protein
LVKVTVVGVGELVLSTQVEGVDDELVLHDAARSNVIIVA